MSADEKRAQLVSVTGIAGIGKSRLVWEFYKYFDGIEQTIYWHRGRCLAYGEEWLETIGRRDEAEPLRAAARETFERLGAVPWLERATATETVTA